MKDAVVAAADEGAYDDLIDLSLKSLHRLSVPAGDLQQV